MKKLTGATRTYEITKDDLPIRIDVMAENLAFCQALVSDVQIKKDGAVAASFPVNVIDDPANNAIRYEIPEPTQQPDLVMVQVIDCTFPDDTPDKARYKVTITSAKGDVEKTNGSRPTINPRTIILTFSFR